jgi:hypothetical protein
MHYERGHALTPQDATRRRGAAAACDDRSWTGRWRVAHRNRQQRGLSAQGPILNRLAGREYRINESRDGEWTVRCLDADGDLVARFGGDVRLVFVALDHFGGRTDSEFGIVVDRVWQREPELSAEMRSLSKRAAAAPQTDLKKRVKQCWPVHWGIV